MLFIVTNHVDSKIVGFARNIAHLSPDAVRLCDVRYSVLCFLVRNITRCNIAHLSPDAVRLVDVRYSVLHFLVRKITRCNIAHLSSKAARLVDVYPHHAV